MLSTSIQISYSVAGTPRKAGSPADEFLAFRCNNNTATAKATASDKAMLQIAPLTPRARVRGTPAANEIQLEIATATKTRRGDSRDRNTIAGPKNALPN